MYLKYLSLLLLPLYLSAFNINSHVWNDLNQDWEKNNGEVSYPNAHVELYTGTGVKLSSTSTDINGNYKFENLAVGEYSVQIIKPSNGIIVTSEKIALWLEENRTDINFGLFNNTIHDKKDFIIYENAEDGKINRWTKTNAGIITNIIDNIGNGHVISFQSNDLYNNPYKLNLEKNPNNFNIKWDMKTTNGFIVDILVTTSQGERLLRYNDANTTEKDGNLLLYGLGYSPTNGKWNTIVRNLEEDLKNFEINNQLLSINAFQLYANAKIDNIELFTEANVIYENAEDGLTNRWSIYGGDSTATISNIVDPVLNSKIISLQGESYAHQYIIGGDYIGETNAWNNKKSNHLQWSMKNSDGFVISLVINTQEGVRYINYSNRDKNINSLNGDTLAYGIGEESSNGEWHTYIRDINADLLKLEPNNKLLSIEGFIVVGNMKLDNLELFHILHNSNTQAGVSLTFDDTTIDSWFNLRTMFTKYDAKATFFISHFYSLENSAINKLKILETDGSEIGCHTYNHKGVTKDFNNDTTRINEYIAEQIQVPYEQMKAAGFNPVSFAYPYGEHHSLYDAAVRTYFPYIRLTFDDFQNDLSKQAAIYHNRNSNYIVLSGAGIDKDFNNSIDEITKALIHARKKGKIITLYGHDVVNDPNKLYNILPQTLEKIIENASHLGLKFYTYKEAYQLGNQN